MGRWIALRYGLCGVVALVLTGCQSTVPRLLSSMGLQKKPVAMALVIEDRPLEAIQMINPIQPYARLQKALTEELGRPVAIDPCFPFQARVGMKNGLYVMALVTPAQFAALNDERDLEVLAVPMDKAGRLRRAALLVVRAEGPVQQAQALRGKVVAFGPRDDSRTHHAAVRLLESAGLQTEDLSLEVLPVRGLKHMPDAKNVLRSVLNQSSHAGFVDEEDWEALPASAAGDELARDKFRVIDRTLALPTRLLVATPELENVLKRRVSAFVLAADAQRPDVLEPLQAMGYRRPTSALLAACDKLAGVSLAVPEVDEAETE